MPENNREQSLGLLRALGQEVSEGFEKRSTLIAFHLAAR